MFDNNLIYNVLFSLSNVGVCEPVDSQDCHNKNDFNVCAPIDFECPGKDDEGKQCLGLTMWDASISALAIVFQDSLLI